MCPQLTASTANRCTRCCPGKDRTRTIVAIGHSRNINTRRAVIEVVVNTDVRRTSDGWNLCISNCHGESALGNIERCIRNRVSHGGKTYIERHRAHLSVSGSGGASTHTPGDCRSRTIVTESEYGHNHACSTTI